MENSEVRGPADPDSPAESGGERERKGDGQLPGSARQAGPVIESDRLGRPPRAASRSLPPQANDDFRAGGMGDHQVMS
jgi:hypothetical protein